MKYFDTRAIHGGEPEEKPEKALNNPIFMTSTFTFEDIKHAEDTFDFKTDDYVYTRGNNPTLKILENKMSLLEEGKGAVAFASGMAAITTTLFSLLKPGDEVIGHKVLYGSTHRVMKEFLPSYGIKTSLVNLTDLENISASINSRTKVIYFETPANPSLDIIDIEGLAKLVEGRGIKIVVDNTFATPYLQRPLKNGADIVVHSATKYIGGHGDVVAGITIGKDADYIHSLKFNYMTEMGGILSPFNAWLLLRGLKTLGLRMEKHVENAVKIAEFLNHHPLVEKVYYPGLPSFNGYNLVNKQMEGPGAMISFELKGKYQEASKFIDELKLFKLAVSLGDAESLIEYPFAMTHRSYTKEELHNFGLTDKLLRLSIGLEDYRDLIKDLEQAFAKIE